MLLTKSVKNAAIHKKIFEFKPSVARIKRAMEGKPSPESSTSAQGYGGQDGGQAVEILRALGRMDC